MHSLQRRQTCKLRRLEAISNTKCSTLPGMASILNQPQLGIIISYLSTHISHLGREMSSTRKFSSQKITSILHASVFRHALIAKHQRSLWRPNGSSWQNSHEVIGSILRRSTSNGCALKCGPVTPLFNLLLKRFRWVDYRTAHNGVRGHIFNPTQAIQEKAEERSHEPIP